MMKPLHPVLLCMINHFLRFGVASILATSLLTTQASGIMSYDKQTFALPATVSQLLLIEDCSTTLQTVDPYDAKDTCLMKGKTYSGSDYRVEVVLYSPDTVQKLDTPFNDTIIPATVNFLDFLDGKVELADFYDEDGFALRTEDGEVENRLFSVISSIFHSDDDAIRDLAPISVNEKVVGYSFTPLERTGDFPSLFTKRSAIVYHKSTGLIAVISIYFDGEFEGYIDALSSAIAGGKETISNEDVEKYQEDRVAFLTLQSEVFEEYFDQETRDATDEEIQDIVDALFKEKAPTIFPDVPPTHLFANAIYYIQSLGIVDGYADGTMKPANSINRAEFVKILVEATQNDGIMVPTTSCFPDVPKDVWFAKYVCFAKQQKLIEGYPDGTFGPEKNINLAESLKILLSAYDVEVSQASGEWFAKYMKTAEENNMLIRMKTKGAAELVSRGEMAELIARVIQGHFYGY